MRVYGGGGDGDGGAFGVGALRLPRLIRQRRSAENTAVQRTKALN